MAAIKTKTKLVVTVAPHKGHFEWPIKLLRLKNKDFCGKIH